MSHDRELEFSFRRLENGRLVLSSNATRFWSLETLWTEPTGLPSFFDDYSQNPPAVIQPMIPFGELNLDYKSPNEEFSDCLKIWTAMFLKEYKKVCDKRYKMEETRTWQTFYSNGTVQGPQSHTEFLKECAEFRNIVSKRYVLRTLTQTLLNFAQVHCRFLCENFGFTNEHYKGFLATEAPTTERWMKITKQGLFAHVRSVHYQSAASILNTMDRLATAALSFKEGGENHFGLFDDLVVASTRQKFEIYSQAAKKNARMFEGARDQLETIPDCPVSESMSLAKVIDYYLEHIQTDLDPADVLSLSGLNLAENHGENSSRVIPNLVKQAPSGNDPWAPYAELNWTWAADVDRAMENDNFSNFEPSFLAK